MKKHINRLGVRTACAVAATAPAAIATNIGITKRNRN